MSTLYTELWLNDDAFTGLPVLGPNTPCFDVSSTFSAGTMQDAVLPGQFCSDPGCTKQKNTVCLLLNFCPPGINPELMMECKLIAQPI